MNFFRTLLICSFLTFSFQSFGQISEKHYRIYSVKAGKEVSLDVIVSDMRNHDVLFFGEEHNDSIGHYLENKVFGMLHREFTGKLALSMEMFDRDAQTVMNEYLGGMIREKNFVKDGRVWNNYKDYKPMVEFAKVNGLDVICANAPGRYTNLAGRKGQKALLQLSEQAKKYMAPLPYDTASGKYYEKLIGLTSHNSISMTDTSKKMPAMPMSSFNLIEAQSLWDATMAWSISEYLNKNKGKKVMQVNGRFHSDEGFAIVTQLKKYSPKLSSLIISSGTDESFPNIDWSKQKHLGDYVVITDPDVPKTF
jgi:uncharacterized iron-regulated protein